MLTLTHLLFLKINFDRTYLFLIHVIKFSFAELLKGNFKFIDNVPAGIYAYALTFTMNKIN